MKNVLTDPEAAKDAVRGSARACNEADRDLRIRLLKEVERDLPGADALETVLEYLRRYDREFVPHVNPDLAFAGTPGFFNMPYLPERSTDWPFGYAGLCWDIGHYCPDYGKAIDGGLPALAAEIGAAACDTPQKERNRKAFSETLALFGSYLERHARRAEELLAACKEPDRRANLQQIADDLRFLETHAPETFRQGLQLLLLMHAYVALKPYTGCLNFGGLDRVFLPLYEAEKRRGTLDETAALGLISEFYLAMSEMDRDTCNISLGGSDESGAYFENDLTFLFLEAQRRLHLEEPSICLKIRPETSDRLWNAGFDLLARGGGMPSFANDARYRAALRQSGFSEAESDTFCIIGCYEALPYGSCFGGTVSGGFLLPAVFAEFFRNAEPVSDFDAFLAAWERYSSQVYLREYLPAYRKSRLCIRDHSASPFLALVLDGCTESLELPENFGARHNVFSVDVGGLATLVDSLRCIKHFVFDTATVSLETYRKQVAENWPDAEFLAEVRSFSGRFGTDDPETNALAAREARRLSELVSDNAVLPGLKMLPALFLWTADIYSANTPATPDGRKNGERTSYGASPAELVRHRDLTKTLSSMAGLPFDRFPIGAPVTLNLVRDALTTAKGRASVRRLLETYFADGGAYVQINAADPDTLEDAQRHPERYGDLLIKISGHTEPFTRLDRTLQNALIERARKGC